MTVGVTVKLTVLGFGVSFGQGSVLMTLVGGGSIIIRASFFITFVLSF
jgi:hypothetical protein